MPTDTLGCIWKIQYPTMAFLALLWYSRSLKPSELLLKSIPRCCSCPLDSAACYASVIVASMCMDLTDSKTFTMLTRDQLLISHGAILDTRDQALRMHNAGCNWLMPCWLCHNNITKDCSQQNSRQATHAVCNTSVVLVLFWLNNLHERQGAQAIVNY